MGQTHSVGPTRMDVVSVHPLRAITIVDDRTVDGDVVAVGEDSVSVKFRIACTNREVRRLAANVEPTGPGAEAAQEFQIEEVFEVDSGRQLVQWMSCLMQAHTLKQYVDQFGFAVSSMRPIQFHKHKFVLVRSWS